MIIRKEFRVESAHIVRNCTSERCSHSVHGHSAVVEVMLESDVLDNAGMVYDFGLMKNTIKQAIDSMDHCYLLWNRDNNKFQNFIKESCDRWISLPFNPSAEQLSMFVFVLVKTILNHTKTNNGEGNIKVKSIRYHETTTGWAECDQHDVDNLFDINWLSQIEFSPKIVEDWGQDLYDIFYKGCTAHNPVIKQQVK